MVNPSTRLVILVVIDNRRVLRPYSFKDIQRGPGYIWPAATVPQHVGFCEKEICMRTERSRVICDQVIQHVMPLELFLCRWLVSPLDFHSYAEH